MSELRDIRLGRLEGAEQAVIGAVVGVDPVGVAMLSRMIRETTLGKSA